MSKATNTTITKSEFLAQFKDPARKTIQADENPRAQWTDARDIREHHGIAPFDADAYNQPALWPNLIDKRWTASQNKLAGGSDLLTVGKPGTGKSTLANHIATREMEVPAAKVVWRASTSRSEWLPLAPWATLCLPSGVDYQARFVPRIPTEPEFVVSLDELTDHVVRDIVRYDDPRHLNEQLLGEGQLHVVYPDPAMSGIQEIYENIDSKQYDAPPDRPLFDPEDPSNHWWFGWILARVEHGPHDWTSLILDEIGDICPQNCRKDQFGTYQKVQLLKDVWVDARKMGLSIFAFGHAEGDIHQMIRHKIRWRFSMNGSANPTSKSEVVGFNDVPMDFSGLTSRMKIGRGLVWNENTFEKIIWDDYEAAGNHKLKLEEVG